MQKRNVLAAVVHELVKVESFDTVGDLADATKCRAARLRIPYDGGMVQAAIRSVEFTRPVLRVGLPGRDASVERARETEPTTSHADAVGTLRRIGVTL